MAIKFLSDVVGSGELEGNTLDVVGAATFQGVGDTALILSSGDVIVGGSHGTSGQVLTSNGENNSLSWTDKTTNTNNYVTSATFNSQGNGVLTLNRTGLSSLTVDLDGRYLQLGGGTMTGNIQITSLSTVSASSFIGSSSNPIVNIYATSISGQLKGTIASTVTGSTQAQDDNSTKIATTAYVDTAISEVPSGSDTTYDLSTTPSLTGIRLAPSSGSNDDILFTGSGGLTITRNSATQLTFNAPSASSTPTLAQVTTAGSTTTNAVTVGTITNNGSITTTTSATVGTTLTVLGNSSLVSLDVGGGFGSTGATISATGNISANGTITGNLTGNVTGNVTGDVTGDVTGAVTGNVTGNLTGNVAGDLNGTINSSTTATTQSQGNSSTKVATTAYVDTAVGNIPSGLAFEGSWNANTDSPSLAGTTPDNGVFYIVSVAGNTSLDGITDWVVGDWAVYVSDGAGTDAWQKIDNTSTLGGAGTAGVIPKWSAATTLADSTISDDGTDVTMSGDLTVSGGSFTLGTSATTTIGKNLLKVPNVSQIAYMRINANETIDTLSAANFRSAIGAGTSSTTGTVTSVAALTLGTTGNNLSSSVSGGTGAAVITLNVPTASANNRGALSSTDWSTFNNKTSNTGTITSVGSTSPITGSASSGGVTIGINTANTSTTGALSSTDWNTFNGKMPLSNITSNYNSTGSKAFIAVGVDGNSNALTYSTDMYYVAGSPSALYSPSLDITNSIAGGSLTISGTSTLDTITSDKDITFTSGTSGGTGLVYDATLGTDGTYSGEVAYFGTTTSTNQGRLYQLQSTGGWAYADADAVSSSSGLLAVALGSSSDNGMLLRGFIRDSDYSALDGTAGAKLYVNTTTSNNSFTADIPTGSGDVVRIVGYVTTAGAKTIYFCPDNTFIQLA